MPHVGVDPEADECRRGTLHSWCDRIERPRSSAGDSTCRSSAGGRAGRRLRSLTRPRGITSVPARMCIRHWGAVKTSGQETTSRAADVRPRQTGAWSRATRCRAGTTRTPGPSRSSPRDGRLSLARPSPTSWVAARLTRSHASRSARLAAYGGMERCFSRREPEWAAAPVLAWSRLGGRGSSYRGARCPSGRAADARGVRTPVASVARRHDAGGKGTDQASRVRPCVRRPDATPPLRDCGQPVGTSLPT